MGPDGPVGPVLPVAPVGPVWMGKRGPLPGSLSRGKTPVMGLATAHPCYPLPTRPQRMTVTASAGPEPELRISTCKSGQPGAGKGMTAPCSGESSIW